MVGFGDLKTPKGHFKINQPLSQNTTADCFPVLLPGANLINYSGNQNNKTKLTNLIVG